MKNTVLITGINGFLGSHLAKRLRADYNIIGVVRDLNNVDKLIDDNFELYESSNEGVQQLFKEHEVYSIIHAATVYRSTESVECILNANILLPIKLYELANKYSVKSFFNTDTFFNQSENNYNYLSEYTLSKKHVIEWLKLMKGECKLLNMKLFHMYGPQDSSSKFVNDIAKKLQDNVQCINLTEGKQKRDFIYINDVVKAYEVVLNNINQLPSFKEFEVGTGASVSIRKFVNKLKVHIPNCTTQLNYGELPYRENEIMESKANIAPLVKLGWNVEFDIDLGICNFLKQTK